MNKVFYRICLLLILICSNSVAQTYNPLWIPDTISGTTFNLTVRDTFRQFLPGQQTIVGAVNGSWWGPTLIWNKGDTVQINLQNDLMDSTTMHWHGIHLPAVADGGPHQPIAPGNSWSPSFEVMNNASTYWYHPHLHMMTEEQVNMGIGGLIIVRDNIESQLLLPRTYGVDDIPVILSDRRFDSSNQLVLAHFGDTMVVNGTVNPEYTVPAQIVRMRILNAAGERFYRFGFSNNATFRVIGTDGGLMNTPVSQTRFTLAPGERVEILVNFAGLTGTSVDLVAYNNTLPGDVAGSSAGTGVFANALGGRQFNMLHLNIGAATSNPITTFPTTLVTNSFPNTTDATVTRHITMSDAGSNCPAAFSGCSWLDSTFFDINVINNTVILNTTEIWEIQNLSAFAHPFHMHNIQFYILDRNGIAAPTYERGWKDVMQVRANTTARFITRFADYADSIRPYMYHCHNLYHEDGGMMGQFLVIDTLRPPVAVLQASDSVICQGECITFTGTAQTNVDHYQWTTTGGTFSVDTLQQFTVCYNTPGTYGIMLVETNQSGSDTIIKNNFIVVNALPAVSLSADDSVCINSGNVILNGLPAGGVYSGQHVTSNNFDPSVAGTFQINYIYTDNNGCTEGDSALITVSDLPVISFSAQDSVCNNEQVQLNAQPSGGIYSGAGVTGNTFNPSQINSGIYIINYHFTDNNGCSNSDSVSILVIDTPATSILNSHIFCNNDSPEVLSATPAGGVFSGLGVTGTIFNPQAASGIFNIYYTYTDINNCSSVNSETFTVNTAPSVTLSGEDSLCSNDNAIVFNGVPAGGMYSGTTTDSIFNPQTSGPGQYQINYIYTDSNGCSNIDSILLTVNALPVIQFTLPSVICEYADSLELIATPTGGTYSGDGVSGNYFYPSMAGSGDHVITYSYTDNNLCTTITTDTITVDTLPLVQIHVVAPVCINTAPFTLNGQPAGGVFIGNGVSGADFYPSNAGTGTHTIQYIYSTSAACSDTGEIFISVNSIPFTDVTADSVFCITDGIEILNLTPLNGALTGAGVVSNTFNPSLTGAGQFTINYSYTDTNNCTGQDSIIMTVYDNPLITFNLPDSVCADEELLLHALPSGGTYSGNGVTDSTFYANTAGTGVTVITYSYGINNCLSIATDSVFVIPSTPLLLNIPDTLCSVASPVQLSATPAGGVFSGIGISNNIFSPQISGTGSFTIVYTYEDSAQCFTSDSSIIEVVICTNIYEIEANNIVVYPNPANTNITILADVQLEEINILNILGEEVLFSNPRSKSIVLNVSELPPGTYLLKLRSGPHTYHKKITKE